MIVPVFLSGPTVTYKFTGCFTNCICLVIEEISRSCYNTSLLIFVVVEEVIPETQRDRFTDVSVPGFTGGFLVMMILDVALG